MTEREWLECADPRAMLAFSLHQYSAERRSRLFAVAACRLIWDAFSDNRSREAIEVAERVADGRASEVERERAVQAANSARSNQDDPHFHAADAAYETILAGAAIFDVVDSIAAESAMGSVDDFAFETAYQAMFITLSSLLREIIGNPFRPVTVDRTWQTSTVTSLATAIYEDRAFDRLPILADALEDAGCDNADILTHCRQPGDHARGCWVVDLLLDRK